MLKGANEDTNKLAQQNFYKINELITLTEDWKHTKLWKNDFDVYNR